MLRGGPFGYLRQTHRVPPNHRDSQKGANLRAFRGSRFAIELGGKRGRLGIRDQPPRHLHLVACSERRASDVRWPPSVAGRAVKWASSVSQLEKVEDALEAVVGEAHRLQLGNELPCERFVLIE